MPDNGKKKPVKRTSDAQAAKNRKMIQEKKEAELASAKSYYKEGHGKRQSAAAAKNVEQKRDAAHAQALAKSIKEKEARESAFRNESYKKMSQKFKK